MTTIVNFRAATDVSAIKKRQQATWAISHQTANRAATQNVSEQRHMARARGALALRIAAALASIATTWMLLSAVVSLSEPRRSQLIAATAGRQLALEKQKLSSDAYPQTWPQTSRSSSENVLESSHRWAVSRRSIKPRGHTATRGNFEQPIADARANLPDWR